MGLYENESDIALVFALGRVIQMGSRERPMGLLSGLHAELMSRGLWPALMVSMTSDYARSLLLAVQLDRAGASKLRRKSAV